MWVHFCGFWVRMALFVELAAMLKKVYESRTNQYLVLIPKNFPGEGESVATSPLPLFHWDGFWMLGTPD
jgi:hypothetical protein